MRRTTVTGLGPAMAALFAASVVVACGGGDNGSPAASPAPAPAPAPAPVVSYTTTFGQDQFPLSEGGAWRQTGLDWTKVIVQNGVAHGTQTGLVTTSPGKYNDSYAYLSGFPANQSAEGVIYLNPTLRGDTFREVEILLRWSDSAHSATGYEVNLSYSGAYTEIMRWDGALGRYTSLSLKLGTVVPKTGDVFKATIIGNQIVAYLNGVEINRARDSTYGQGNPGIGFYIDPDPRGPNADYGFTSFSARSLP